MEIEKITRLSGPAERIWRLLLSPDAMRVCVPGVESVETLGERDYLIGMRVKMSFVSARFKIRTTVLEVQPPWYLKCMGTGEDSTLTSSLKQASEVFLAEVGDGTTELRTKSSVEVMGRLGTFGISMLKTKADRLWEEFGRNLASHIQAETARM